MTLKYFIGTCVRIKRREEELLKLGVGLRQGFVMSQ